MPTTPETALPRAPTASSDLLSDLPTHHEAQRHQLLEQQRRREQAAQGLELQPISTSPKSPEASTRTRGRNPRGRSESTRGPAGTGSSAATAAEDTRTLLHNYSDSDPDLDDVDDDDDEDDASRAPMHSRPRPKNSHAPDRLDLAPSSPTGQNGRATMNQHVEYRGKSSSMESPTANLMGREDFSLDHEPPDTPLSPSPVNRSFYELPIQDRRNFLLLVLLYFLQGIPMGLATGSVPFLLKAHLSYSQIGVFSLASYPYSLKLLWSPIVDAVWSARVGRRKSWIMPIQMLSGFGMIWLGGRAKQMMVDAGAGDGSGVWAFTGWWFFLVFMCATQDIAVDGWALTLLSPQNLSYASTAQTVGLTAGQFLSYTVFLAFNSPGFANRWFRATPKDYGVMTLGGYLTFWGWAYLLVTVGLAVLKREERTRDREGIAEVYRVMWGILKLKNIQTFIVVHLIAKIGFQANDGVTNLKLLDKGFSQEDLALTVLIDFPFEIALGYYVGKWSSSYPPMRLWCGAFVGRLIAALLAQGTVMIFPKDGVTQWYLLVVIAEHIFSTFTNTIMFVAVSAFHAKIADPTIGGTYMTLLATVSNLGGTFPRIFILKLVDVFTVATCIPPSTPPAGDLKGSLITAPFSCAMEAEKHRCIDGGGACVIQRDGYYITNIACVVVGAITFWSFIGPAALKLQALPLRAWRQPGGAHGT
ncbi:MAG: hypothetical protein M1832_003333 [Thelocarpon impressellum]|nr:MAG: hypothetical protein M1832_003333 [Thelocarpon impressellum]